MFDFGAIEILLIVVVAVIVIGPKDMPMAMRQAGRWIAQMRKLSGHFRSGLDAMVREAELDDMEKKWAAKNEKIMKEHPPEKAGASAEAKAADSASPNDNGSGDEPQMTPLKKIAEAPQPVAKESDADAPSPDTTQASKA